ncbi:LAO/AO transport system kinase [Lewinella marina]|uniref:Methylmalonyl Co-A mutase-associated GTPase MeaB n=1 Tax=Neolewinella marina TaxID=438751 RepID=A0A2G0CEK3_9BACT|nr:methylmalonyl Co-A mutase-associated GTPase MeaB [Neolewinella marina]NJB87335.1 LAO/AO transport system kinase [Neolewinella marina]PHK98347.1 methylmalonyl Co-A mutase-associated GTPase MeaB [Neolewinella marina]
MDPATLFADLQSPRHRRALGRAITLVESNRPEDQAAAAQLIALAERCRPPKPTFRLGISGTPGVGKSTFIEAFGLELVRRGHRLAVLAIDPTSSLSGGSILGDKTRMELLTREEAVYIRPSPNAGELGGVGPASRAAVLLCEAAGYDYLIVETVGVGQAEWQVHGMTDAFLLLAQPAAGDDLQGIKRGILELADHLVVNKADALPREARLAAAELRRGLHLAPARPDGWTVEVATASALTGAGIPEVADRLEAYRERLGPALADRRRRQRGAWLREHIRRELLRKLDVYLKSRGVENDELLNHLDEHITIPAAADVILADFLKSTKS